MNRIKSIISGFVPKDRERARHFANWAAAASALWGLLYALIGVGLLIPSLEPRAVDFGWRVMANVAFAYTPVMFRPKPSVIFLYAYLYLTLAFGIYRLSKSVAVTAAVIFVALQLWFTYYWLFVSEQLNFLPAFLLVAAFIGLRGTLYSEKATSL